MVLNNLKHISNVQVILKKDVENLGFQYEEISVKPGYARNYLIPKGYAQLATTSIKKQIQEILKQRAKKETDLLKQADKIAQKLHNIHLKIVVKAGSEGKLFGSINNQYLSEELTKQGFQIDKKNILIPGNTIKVLGKYKAKIRLHLKLEAMLSFELITSIKDSNEKD